MIWQDMQRIRSEAPLVLNVTNYVVMNTTANALLAAGASPVMAHAIEEMDEMADLARAVVINMGTLNEPWVASMHAAGLQARRRGKPVVLDPVGCGATPYRTQTARRLVGEIGPAIIRGNASEIRALVQPGGPGESTKGVDSRHTPDEVLDDALVLARQAGCVVVVSGAVDVVTDGRRVARVANGHPLMPRVTGMGCTASAMTGAVAAVNPSGFEAATHAMAVMGIAGELAAARSQGPGSFQMHFLDALHALQATDIAQRQKIETH